MMIMRMMVELMVSWISAEVKEVLRNLSELVVWQGSQMGESVIPIWPVCWLPLLMLFLRLPQI
jgi:hypothetical protein